MTEQKKIDYNIKVIVIVGLLLVIAIMGFFLGKDYNTKEMITTATDTDSMTSTTVGTETKGTETKDTETKGTEKSTMTYEDLIITVIDDKRCVNCPTDQIIEQLNQLPSIKNATIIRKDFSDEGIVKILNENEIKALPLIMFSTNNFDVSADPLQKDQNGQSIPTVNSFLKVLPTGNYTLEIGSKFNPFEKRSEKGFLILDKKELQAIKDNSYIEGNKDSKITWLEYSDLECPFCAKLHNSGTIEELAKKYGDDLNRVFNHFPLGFHKNAQPGAEILECLAEQKGSDAFYSLIKKSFSVEDSSKSYLIKGAIELGANEKELNECISSGKYTEKVKGQMAKGAALFGITGTPGNILINNATGEYEIISGAYPTEAFTSIIDRLLK